MTKYTSARESRLSAVCSIVGSMIVLVVMAVVDFARANVRQLTVQGYLT